MGAADETVLLTMVDEGMADDDEATLGATVEEADETTTDEEEAATDADDELLAAVLTADELAEVTVTLVALATARKRWWRQHEVVKGGKGGRRTDVVLGAVRGERPRRVVPCTVVVVDEGRVGRRVVGVERALRARRAARRVVAAKDRVLRRRNREGVGGRVGHSAVEGGHVEVAGALRIERGRVSSSARTFLNDLGRAEPASGPTRSRREGAVDARCWRARTSRLQEREARAESATVFGGEGTMGRRERRRTDALGARARRHLCGNVERRLLLLDAYGREKGRGEEEVEVRKVALEKGEGEKAPTHTGAER